MVDLQSPLHAAVGGRTEKVLHAALGMNTVGDLLTHYPRRYAERGALTDLSQLRIDDHVTVMGEILSVQDIPFKGRKGRRLDVRITDHQTKLALTFFNQSWRMKELIVGQRGLFAGKVTMFNGTLQLTHPDYSMLQDEDAGDEFASARLIPVYPATAKAASWKIAGAVRTALGVIGDLEDPLPEQVRAAQGLPGLVEALNLVHVPATFDDVTRGRDRLKFDEAFLLQTRLAQLRRDAQALPAQARTATAGGLRDAFDQKLPFALTEGQVEVSAQIDADLAQSHPMHRLLQGDVGSGKTIVALRAMLAVVDAGGQAALLAPTEVLAVQHHRTFLSMLGDLAQTGLLAGDGPSTGVTLLTGSMGTAARRAALLDIVSGESGIVVGTHALLEDKVTFNDLGLVVVDEQHRFGVEQRAALAAKSRDGSRPHVLVMTATPIPRTVAMTVFGDLDVSTLSELPKGRQQTATHVVPAEKPAFQTRAWERIREEVAAGRQAYVVCPRIGSGDLEEGAEILADEGAPKSMAAVEEVVEDLASGPLEGLRVEALHGRMTAEDKDRAMSRFAAGDLDVLVSTTVIEVGVDVPNATVMTILDADRFGISQLHQLRGRVGRGQHAGLCLLFTSAPPGSPARERLDVVASTTDGFALSRFDLEARREGNVLGASQSGRFSKLRLLSALRDEEVILRARTVAADVVGQDPKLEGHPALARAVAAMLDEQTSEYLEKS